MSAVRAPEASDSNEERGFEAALAAARVNDPWGFQTLYDAHAGRVLGYLRSHGAADPEDLTSEVFLRAFTRLDSFVGDEIGWRSWLFTITHRVLLDERRRRDRRPQVVSLQAPVIDTTPGGDTETDSLTRLESSEVSDRLAQLPPDQRDVITLRVVADLAIDDVARALGKRRGAVKALQRRGLARLRRILEEEA